MVFDLFSCPLGGLFAGVAVAKLGFGGEPECLAHCSHWRVANGITLTAAHMGHMHSHRLGGISHTLGWVLTCTLSACCRCCLQSDRRRYRRGPSTIAHSWLSGASVNLVVRLQRVFGTWHQALCVEDSGIQDQVLACVLCMPTGVSGVVDASSCWLHIHVSSGAIRTFP